MDYCSYTTNTASVELPYMLWKPEDMRADEQLPLLVFLHGAGERAPGLEKLLVHSVPRVFSKPHSYRCVMLAPQCPAEETWYPYLHELKDLILAVAAAQHCDMDRISLTGISMGGYGTWELGLAYPELFSCIAPICGGGTAWRAPRLKDMPIRAFHGTADTAVFPERAVEMIEAVRKAGNTHAELLLCHGVGHDVWDYAYESSKLIEWMLSQRRNNTEVK